MSTQPLLLSYGINLKPKTPIAGSSVEIDLVITNDSSAGVVLQGIKIELPVGDTSTDMTYNATGIVSSCPANWKACPSQAGTGNIIFIFQPVTGKVTVNPNDSFTLTLINVGLNTAAGTATLIITEGSANNPTESFEITKYPGSWGSINFSALPANISAGDSVTLSWTGPVDAIYSIQYIDHSTNSIVNIPASGQPVLSNEGQYPGAKNPPLTPSGSTLFTLQVQQVVDNVFYKQEFQQTVSVIPAPPQITSFNYALLSNNSVQFNWTTTGASRVEGSWSSEELKANNPMPSTSATVPYVVGTIYTITAYSSDNHSCSASNKLWKSGTTVLTLSSGVTTSCTSIPFSPDGQHFFIGTTAKQLMMINVTTQAVINTLTLTSNPAQIAITPNGQYLVALLADQTLSVVDLSNFTVVKTLQVFTEVVRYKSDYTLGITPDSRYALATYDGCDSLAVIDLTTIAPCIYIKLGNSNPFITVTPNNLAIAPNGKQAFVTDSDFQSLIIIDLATLSLVQTISLGGETHVIAITLDSHYVLVGTNGYIRVFNTTNLTDTPQSIPIGSTTFSDIAVTANGLYAFVADYNTSTVSVLDLSPLGATPQSVAVGSRPNTLAITADSNYVFVGYDSSSSAANTVSVIDVNNLSFPPQDISMFGSPTAFATPDINTVFILKDKGVQTLVAKS